MFRLLLPFIAVFLIVMSGCNFAKYEKLDNGLEYRIQKGKGGDSIAVGNFIEITMAQYYKDSLLTPHPMDTIPQVLLLDSMSIPPEYITIFTKARVGDKIDTRISTDSIAAHQPLPPSIKTNEYITSHIEIVNLYTSQTDAEAANMKLRDRMIKADSVIAEKQKSVDDKAIQDYLKKNNIQAEKSPEGTYVEVSKQGDGPKVDSGKAVSVLYKGTLFDGKVFDESYDSTGKPTQPFTFIVGMPGAIPGWSDGMVYFNEGGSGRLFIPSGRAYGTRGAGMDIAPNTPLIFEVNITKVQDQDAYRKQMEEDRKKAMEETKK